MLNFYYVQIPKDTERLEGVIAMIDTWSMAYSLLVCVVRFKFHSAHFTFLNVQSHYHLQGWGSSSDGAEKIFCNSPNKLKTENVNVDFVSISSIVEGGKYI